MVDFEFGDRFLTKVLNFLGMEVMPTVFAEGMDHFPKQVPEIMAKAKEQAIEAARKWQKKQLPFNNKSKKCDSKIEPHFLIDCL